MNNTVYAYLTMVFSPSEKTFVKCKELDMYFRCLILESDFSEERLSGLKKSVVTVWSIITHTVKAITNNPRNSKCISYL